MTFAKAFPHVRVGSTEHRAIIRELKKYVQLERIGLPGCKDKRGWESDRNLITLPFAGLDILGEVRSCKGRKSGPVKVFEVGCGKGHTLRTLKTIEGDTVHVDGITLTKNAADYAAGNFDDPDVYTVLAEVFHLLPLDGPEIKNVEPVHVRVGLIEGADIQHQDFIFSFEAMRYVFDPARALEKIANGLSANNGNAALEVPEGFLEGDIGKGIREHLKRNGIIFRMELVRTRILGLLGKAARCFIYMQRNSDAQVDLNPFYKIRTEEVYQDPGGDGRNLKSSPLTH